MRHPAVLLLAPALLLAAPARADGPVQAWPAAILSVGLGGKWSATGDVVGRISRDPARASQLRWRVSASRRVGARVTLALSYARTVSYNRGRRDGIEDQLAAQLGWAIGTIGPVALSSRTRLEQRFIVGADRTAWRLREQIRAVLPIKGTPVSGVAWAEPFVALNRTSATPVTFDQLRAFAGVSLRLSRHADVEFGYLNQHIHRLSGDVSNDVVPVVLNLHF